MEISYKILRKTIVRFFRPLSALFYFLNTFDYKMAISSKPVINEIAYPWITTTAIKWLMTVNLKEKKILEFGSGYSTIFFCLQQANVFTLERNEKWKNKILSNLLKSKKKPNFITEENLKNFKTKEFDIVFVDDNRREERLYYALDCLNDDGFIIFDNSDRFPELMSKINKMGYIIFNFWGNCSDTHRHICTSVILRNNKFVQNI